MGNLIIYPSSSVCVCLVLTLIKVLHKLWWILLRIQHQMRAQGIKGLSYKFIYGNTKDIIGMRKEGLAKPMPLIT